MDCGCTEFEIDLCLAVCERCLLMKVIIQRCLSERGSKKAGEISAKTLQNTGG